MNFLLNNTLCMILGSTMTIYGIFNLLFRHGLSDVLGWGEVIVGSALITITFICIRKNQRRKLTRTVY